MNFGSIKDLCNILATTKFEYIDKRRAIINKELKTYWENKKDKQISESKNDFLVHMFQLYDQYFFNNYLDRMRNQCSIYICWEDICLNTERRYGTTKKRNNLVIISFPKETMTRKDDWKNVEYYFSNGIKCHNIIECLQVTFEHELIHALMLFSCPKYMSNDIIIDPKSDWSLKTDPQTGHSKTFMTIANNVFGHTNWVSHAYDKTVKISRKLGQKDYGFEKARLGDMVKVYMGENQWFQGEIGEKSRNEWCEIVSSDGRGKLFPWKYVHYIEPKCSVNDKKRNQRMLVKYWVRDAPKMIYRPG